MTSAMVWRALPSPDPASIASFRRAKRSKFLVDESLGHGTTEFLRERKINVVDVLEVGLKGRDDREVFNYAWRAHRILLTHDEDFWNDRQFPEHRNPGVVILPGADGNNEDMLYGLVRMLLLVTRDPDQWRKQKVKITRNGDIFIRGRHGTTNAMMTSHYRMPLGRGPAAEWIADGR